MAVLTTEPRTSCVLGTRCTTELYPPSPFLSLMAKLFKKLFKSCLYCLQFPFPFALQTHFNQTFTPWLHKKLLLSVLSVISLLLNPMVNSPSLFFLTFEQHMVQLVTPSGYSYLHGFLVTMFSWVLSLPHLLLLFSLLHHFLIFLTT